MLSKGPSRHALSFQGYLVNGQTFYTKYPHDKSTIQNSGVTLIAESMHISGVKDKNPIYAKMLYYDIIESIFELDYTTFLYLNVSGMCRSGWFWTYHGGLK